ncbi:hypothetical protein GCM10023116_40410 [Kistimonas scapharcae]|uniref:Uncharacterized protein n=1 Tax=Kistimonas scapharcae TaxID=1036133 RepID=A0ABP8V7F8_9GAMM
MKPRYTEKRHVAIIGAGYAGLITAHALKEKGIQVSVFEKQSGPGGLWRYAERHRKPPDIRHNTDPLSSAIYPGLRTNLPIELMTLPNLPDFFTDQTLYTISESSGSAPVPGAICQLQVTQNLYLLRPGNSAYKTRDTLFITYKAQPIYTRYS